MTSLDRQDGASGGKKDGVGKEWGRTKVSANANGLYYSRCSSHGSDISESRVELELATCDGLLSK